jgi:hypothetical protein
MANGDDINQSSKQFDKNLHSASGAAKKIVDSLEGFGKTQVFQSLVDQVRVFSKELEKSEGIIDQLKQGEVDLATAQSKSAQMKKVSNKLDSKASDLETQILNKMKKSSAAEKKAIKDKIQGIKDQGSAANKSMKNVVNMAAKGETKSVQFLSNMSKGAKGMGFDKAAKATGAMAKGMRGAAVAGKGFGAALKVAGKVGLNLLKAAGVAMGPMGWLMTGVLLVWDLVKFIMKINSEVVSISKNMGVSQAEARKFRNSLFDAAYESNNILNTQQELLKVHGQFNDAWGTTILYLGNDFLNDMATLQNRFELSAEAALNLGANVMASGRPAQHLLDLIGEGGVAMEHQLDVQIDQWKVVDSVAKTTGQMRALYYQNEGALGRVVARAQVLGMTMGEIFKSSQGMLNFHSSIEKELSAELFLGRQLNLETARLAALTGDMETFHSEILKNAGDYLDFTRMNVLEQKALADALGMGVDQLADMLFEQTKLEDLKGRASAREFEDIKNAKQQLTIQQSFNAAMEQLKMIFTDLMDGLESWVMPGWMAKVFNIEGGGTAIFSDMKKRREKEWEEGDSLSGTGLTAPQDMTISAGDLRITTLPEDTLVLGAGTHPSFRNNNQGNQRPMVVDASIDYDSYGAVKASKHHHTKWND